MSVTFKDIHAMIAARPALPDNKITTSAGDLPMMLERAQGCCHPEIKRPRAAYYASAYGKNDIAETQATLMSLTDGKHGIQKFCTKLNADLRVYELTIDAVLPVDGLKEQEAAHLVTYGLMAVEEHVDCLMISSLSTGFRDARAAFDKAMTDEPEADIFVLAARYGGQDMCALLGAALSARMAKIPVVAGLHTGNVLKRALARLYPESESTLVIATATDAAEPIRVLHYVYEAIGTLLAYEATPQKAQTETKKCVGCAA